MERIILHSDLNNFYASVECLYHPELREKPVAVCGDPELRHGIVLAKNQLAKGCGIKTGEVLWQARQKCPELVLVPPSYERYLSYSAMAKEIYQEYTDQVESFGLDECWLDVTGSTALFGGGCTLADRIRERIRRELGVTASVGVSFNKVFAKLGSDLRKPDATTAISPRDFREKIWPLPVQTLLYVGRATQNKLQRYGIRTIGELARADRGMLQFALGKNGLMLWAFANGLDTSPVSNIGAKSLIKSIGNSTTTPRDLLSDGEVRITLLVLSESVAARMREHQFRCRTVQLSVRSSDLTAYERQEKLLRPTCTAQEMFEAAFRLYKRHHDGSPIRSLGVRACDLLLEDALQMSFLPELRRAERLETLERTMDQLRARFGHFSIQRGIMLTDRQLSNLNPKDDHVIHPEGFLTK